MPERLSVAAPAKVNLGLAVGPLGPDGYHPVRTVLAAVSLWDRVDLARAPDVTLAADAPGLPAESENLAWRAARALRRAAGLAAGVRVRLRKRIPLQAGLGGGSADAAAVLAGCNRLWGLGWPVRRLAAVAGELGADVPYFLTGGTALAEGRGERVTPLPSLPPWPVVLARGGQGVSTAEAYAAFDALANPPRVELEALLAGCARRPAAERSTVAAGMGNALEAAVLPRRADVAALRGRLRERGACAALLCGSGSAVWALAPSAAWARRTAAELCAEGLWARASRLHPGGLRILAPFGGGRR